MTSAEKATVDLLRAQLGAAVRGLKQIRDFAEGLELDEPCIERNIKNMANRALKSINRFAQQRKTAHDGARRCDCDACIRRYPTRAEP